MMRMAEPLPPAGERRQARRSDPIGSALPADQRRPAGLTDGPGHIVIHGNAAFRSTFGRGAIGLPARESMLALPATAFALLDEVFRRGRPLARWIDRPDGPWRWTVAPRRDPETDAVIGVSFHLRARDDLPIWRTDDPLD